MFSEGARESRDVSRLPDGLNNGLMGWGSTNPMALQTLQHSSFRAFQELFLRGGIFDPEADVHSASYTLVVYRLVDF